MKVRCYRGPYDGKVVNARDGSSEIQFEKIAIGSRFLAEAAMYPTAPINTNRFVYRRTNFRHPDGSIFFEWDQPKGTRFAKPS